MFFLSILNRNIEVYYTQMDKRKTHRTLDWTSGLWISTKFANLVKKMNIYIQIRRMLKRLYCFLYLNLKNIKKKIVSLLPGVILIFVCFSFETIGENRYDNQTQHHKSWNNQSKFPLYQIAMVLIDTIFTVKQKDAWPDFALIYIYKKKLNYILPESWTHNMLCF